MKRNIYMVFLLIGVIATSIMVGGCSNSAEVGEKVTRVERENQELKDEAKQLQEKNQKLEEEIEKLEPKPVEEEKVEDPVTAFDIYGADSNTYEKELISGVDIKDTLTLEEKLEVLAEELSKAQFQDLGIELDEIEDEDGKKIAVINLIEVSDEEEISWDRTYFQGSTGGIVTTVSLEETFLQKEYDGDWVDGVRFLYEGEKIMYDHVQPLGEISFR